jgi:hypothetical protein
MTEMSDLQFYCLTPVRRSMVCRMDDLMALVKSVAVFNRLMARGVNFTAMRDEDGATLCHHVARNVTCEDDLRFLVNVCGNDAVHAVDNYGRTPLHWASSSGNDSAVRVLVELGAEIDRQDNDGWTALINAAANVQSSCVELLLALGADVDLVTNDGPNSVPLRRVGERPASLCALVAAGGDLDQPDNKGETPRMIAIRENVALPTPTRSMLRAVESPRLDSIWCANVHSRSVSDCNFRLNALQLCEILMHSFGAIGSLIAFHQWWAIATKVKHFQLPNT